jgi:hypothetical protein
MKTTIVCARVLVLVGASLLVAALADESLLPAASPLSAIPEEEQGGGKDKTTEGSPLLAKERMILVNFDGPTLPVNGDKDGYPNNYPFNGRDEGGKAVFSIEKTDAISGQSLRAQLTSGYLYLQFNPYNGLGKSKQFPGPRAFARDYAQKPTAWKFNTYNRMRFWIKVPTNTPGHYTNGKNNSNVGTYVKRVADPDWRSDEAGGNHYYHNINLPGLGEWTQVILNMHPDHRRGSGGGVDPGILAHPTNEDKYNYFDALTRFYIQYEPAPKSYPADFLLDEVEFYRELATENDTQAYTLTATYAAATNRLIVTWCRKMADDESKHEVRYAFSDIHASGWKAATPAPNGIIKPLGDGAYNNMVYDTTAIDLSKQAFVFIAIKPQNSDVFSQIVVPLTKKPLAAK